MASSIKGRGLACSASVGAILGAAAALVPASCGSAPGPNLDVGTGGAGGATTSTGSVPGAGGSGVGGFGVGGLSASGGSKPGAGGSSVAADGGEPDSTLVDLDGGADAGHPDAPHTSHDADVS